MIDYQKKFKEQREQDVYEQEQAIAKRQANAELEKYKEQQKREERSKFIYTTKLDIEHNFPEAFDFITSYAIHNSEMLKENYELTEQLQQARLNEGDRLTQELKDLRTQLKGTDVLYVEPNTDEDIICYEPEKDGTAVAIIEIPIIKNAKTNEVELVSEPFFISDLTNQNSRLKRLKTHYQKALESAKLILADSILESQKYVNSTKLMDKLLHPVTHQSNLAYFESRVNTAYSCVAEIENQINIIEQKIKYIKTLQTKDYFATVKKALITSNKLTECTEKSGALGDLLVKYRNPSTIAVPIDVYLETPEIDIVQATNALYKLVKFLKASNITLRYNDGTKGFPIQNYVDFGAFEPEILALLEYLDANPTFAETLKKTSTNSNDKL